MSFLMGAYGKLMAGRHYRQLQNRLTDVMRQMRGATRDVANMEKSLQQQQRMAENGIRQQGMMSQMMMSSIFGSAGMGDEKALKMLGARGMNISGFTPKDPASMGALNNYQQQMQYQMQAQMQSEQANLQNYFDMQREFMLQPLKDIEEELTTEKESLESQIQIAKAEYEAKQQEEKDGAKSIAPQYTAG